MEKVLFFHGGPGLNGNPEQKMLTELYRENGLELCVFHEPSFLRPDSEIESVDFDNYLKSSEGFFLKHYTGTPLILMVHCFGCNVQAFLTSRHADKIRLVFIVTPDFNLNLTDKNILGHIMDDYRHHGSLNEADELRMILDNEPTAFDRNMRRGWELVAGNPRFFNYYWLDERQQEAFLQHYAEPEYNIDAKGFFAVRETFYDQPVNVSSIKTIVAYGKHDQLISVSDEIAELPKRFSNYTLIEMENSAHYPHIEEPEAILQVLMKNIM